MTFRLLVFSVLIALSVSAAYADQKDVAIELLYPNGDRATINEATLVVESTDGTYHTKISGNNSMQNFQVSLDSSLNYRIHVYVHDMLISTKLIGPDDLDGIITINIPSSGGLKFFVYYNDGTPIEDAILKLYSHEGNLIRTGNTDSKGQTLRFWISTTPYEDNHYVPTVLLDNGIAFTHTHLKLLSGSTDVKIVTPWPSEIDYLHITAQKDKAHGMHSWNDEYLATLTGDEFVKTVPFNRGQAHFAPLPIGVFELTIFERDRPHLIWANQTVVLDKKTNDIKIIVQDPYPTNTSSETPQVDSTIGKYDSNMLADLNFLKQSISGTQNYSNDGITSFLELVTDGDNLPVFTRSYEINEDLSTSRFSANIFVNEPGNVDELLFTFTSDNFESGWYTYSVPFEIISKNWSEISFTADELELTGTQDITSIDRMQIRIRDNGVPISLGISSVSFVDDNEIQTMYETCNCVAFRLDDIQDYFITDVQMALIETFQKNNVELTIGIIANNIGRDMDMTDFLSNISDKPGIEFANHGWDNEPITQFDTVGQEMLLLKSNNKIASLFGVKPTVFIPPQNSYNDETIAALTSLGFTHLSSELDFTTPPFPLSGQTLYHFPETAFTGKLNEDRTRFVGLGSNTTFEQMKESISEHGFAVITLHPQEFSLFYNQNYQNKVNSAQIEQLEALFSKIQEYNINTVLISEINTEPNQKVLVPQWIKNNAKWWIENRVSTEEFLNSLEFLISTKIIHVSQTEQTDNASHIPNWIQQNIGWWVDGRISDSEFVFATEFLIQNGIIQI
ncbi:MAG: polysaccharide deacetylase family protein [Nitrosarchaeum sp.]|nr:polysaccharide deacetylase family protein [Nitrosarchaeum sp.]